MQADRSVLVGCALAVMALAGWTSFTYSAWSSHRQVSALQTDRDEAVANHRKLADASGELGQVEAKLAATRVEYSRAVQSWAETRSRIGAAQQELAALGKRLDQAKDRVSQTGSIRARDPGKGAARKP